MVNSQDKDGDTQIAFVFLAMQKQQLAIIIDFKKRDAYTVLSFLHRLGTKAKGN